MQLSGAGQLALELHETGAQRPALQARPVGQVEGHGGPASAVDFGVAQAASRSRAASDLPIRPQRTTHGQPDREAYGAQAATGTGA